MGAASTDAMAADKVRELGAQLAELTGWDDWDDRLDVLGQLAAATGVDPLEIDEVASLALGDDPVEEAAERHFSGAESLDQKAG